MPVIIEAAGDHDFDLAHIRREGGEDLLRRLLEKGGLPLQLNWRFQIQKKLNCHAETPPVRVVDSPRKWAVHLKIKPGDNNTCHYCSLLMPDGFSGEKLYYQLAKASAELDRNWRHKAVEPTNGAPNGRIADLFPSLPTETAPKSETPVAIEPQTTPLLPEAVALVPVVPTSAEASEPASVPAAEVPTSAEAREPANAPAPEVPALVEASVPAHAKTGHVRGWLSDPDKIQLLLLAIHEINEGGAYPHDRWVELLCQRMDWTNANRHEVGGVLTALIRKDFIERRLRGSRPFGYLLSEAGQRIIADLVRSTPATPSPLPLAPAPVPAVPVSPAAVAPPTFPPRNGSNPADIIRSFGPIAQQFLDANARLESIAQREEDLITELELLKEEREQICRLLDDNRVQSVLANLARLVQVKN